jgi:hypothetical protein
LTGFYSKKHYPEKLRRIRFFDMQKGKRLVFFTNQFDLSPKTIAAIYRSHPGAHPGLVHPLRRLQAMPPQKQPLQRMPEQIDARPPETTEKSIDRMGREHGRRFALNDTGIASVGVERIKMHKVPFIKKRNSCF